MPSARILDSGGSNQYNAVAYMAMPAGTNAVGVTWKICYLASFSGRQPTSRLTIVGNGPGQITQQELNSIQSGDLIEIPFIMAPDADQMSDMNTMNELIDLFAARTVDQFKSDFAARFRFYGLVRP